MDFLQYKRLHVHPAAELKGEVGPPASKSSSARAVLAAALAPGRSRVDNVAFSNNVRAMVECCRALGAAVHCEPDGVTVTGPDRMADGTTLNPGNSGIVLRLLLGATAGLRGTTFMSPYLDSLGRRSNSEMIAALRALGVVCQTGPDDTLPIVLDGAPLHAGPVQISGRRSSQFLSGLLFLGGLLDEPLSIKVVDELHAQPMVRTTLSVLRTAGVDVDADEDLMVYRTSGRSSFQPARHRIGSDPASTAALLAVAASVESTVELTGVRLEELTGVLDHLRATGVMIEEDGATLRVRGGGELAARDFDGATAPDAVLPLAALAARAGGTSRFHNIEHLRYKECDRISDFRRELDRAGVSTEERRDELIVHGSPATLPGGIAVDSHYDHGVIMAMSVLALTTRSGLTINDPQYVGQTYPDFFGDLVRLGATVTA